MDAYVSLITLGVADLERAVAFYRDGLGWPLSSASVEGEVAFFRTGGAVIALWGRAALAADAGVADSPLGFSGIALAHNVPTERQVDAVLAQAASAGAIITRPAQPTFFGRHGYFADPDGHLWEVAWNPGFLLGTDGQIMLPE
jgi:catechol 2,3-dioxygenase-like lactoylglutathione lyase family enzyme